MVVISIILFALFTLIIVEDFKTRTIPLWLLLILGVCVVINGILYNQPGKFLLFFSINVLFTLAQWAVLTLYFSFRSRKPVNIVNRYIGSGDIIFLLISCAYFAPVNFIVFQLLSFTLILIFYGVIGFVNKTRSKHIPLAGSLALAMNIFIILPLMGVSVNSYNDSILLKYLL